jgi:hypothetical protein
VLKRVKNKWVKALRSGKYQQGSGQLRFYEDSIEPHYCCLGVLAHITDPDEKTWKEFYGTFGRNEEQARLIGNGGISEEVTEKLVRFNDEHKWSFKRIANYIEKYV